MGIDSGESGNSEIELKEGEFICDVCNGTGLDPKHESIEWYFKPTCPKCQGKKKLDWISIATGIPKEPDIVYGASSSSSFSLPGHLHTCLNTNISPGTIELDAESVNINGVTFKEYIQDELAQYLANEIDKRVVEALKKEKEQKPKKWRKFFDNRIFSKFMFFNNFKQRIKSKKD